MGAKLISNVAASNVDKRVLWSMSDFKRLRGKHDDRIKVHFFRSFVIAPGR
jgi:hypothetical protein